MSQVPSLWLEFVTAQSQQTPHRQRGWADCFVHKWKCLPLKCWKANQTLLGWFQFRDSLKRISLHQPGHVKETSGEEVTSAKLAGQLSFIPPACMNWGHGRSKGSVPSLRPSPFNQQPPPSWASPCSPPEEAAFKVGLLQKTSQES